MPGMTSSSDSPNCRYMSSRHTSPRSVQWLLIIMKLSASSLLNRIRWALNSASASMSLIIPDTLSLPSVLVVQAFELGAQLIQADRDDLRISGHAAGRYVRDPAVRRDAGRPCLQQRVDGAGDGHQQPVDLPVPVREVLGYLVQHGAEGGQAGRDLHWPHLRVDAPQLVQVQIPDRLAELGTQVGRRVVFPGVRQHRR